MATTYTWKVTGVKKGDVNILQDVVLNVRWEKIGTDENGHVGKFSGATPFAAPHPSAFVPFNELNEALVLSWVQAVVVDSYEQHVNEQIEKQIDALKNPVSEVSGNDLPWV